ncbi:alpha/beta hydrolase [Amycolatopsis ultiminotia]|uniref:Alpha/beta hydrolase n=2 Tax=Amycolatopsis ultiminotia TaxID=543629 RepID=A0ABP6YEQ7_9PSEU
MTSTAVQERDVEFRSGPVTLRGWLRTPATEGPHPLVILAHGLGGLKEWTIPEVAAALTEAGIAALAFDYRNFGDSDGQPREEVDHPGQIDDWRNAVTFATTLPEIDSERIGLWGTSLGGRNVLAAGALDHRIRCIYAQVPPIGSVPEAIPMMLGTTSRDEADRILADDLRNRALGAEPEYVDFPIGPEYEYDAYWAGFGEAEKRNWTPHVTVASFAPSLADDIRPLLPLISPTPVFLVVAEADAYCPPALAKPAFDTIPGPKKLLVVDGHHYSVYTDFKDETIVAAREWFVEHLVSA